MAVVRKSRCEGRAIVECVEGLALRELELLLESEIARGNGLGIS
jgi:hypothetical protein